MSVANASTGIPEAYRERFYRADPSHNRQIEGMGLRLSLSREITRAHGGGLAAGRASGEGSEACAAFAGVTSKPERTTEPAAVNSAASSVGAET